MFKLSCEPGKIKDLCSEDWAIDFTDEDVCNETFKLAVGDIIYNVREYTPTSLKGKKGKPYKYIEKDEIIQMILGKDGWKIKFRPPSIRQSDFTKSLISIGKSAFMNGEIPDEYYDLRIVSDAEDYDIMQKDLRIDD